MNCGDPSGWILKKIASRSWRTVHLEECLAYISCHMKHLKNDLQKPSKHGTRKSKTSGDQKGKCWVDSFAQLRVLGLNRMY